jgi:tripeptidyl-peptidase-1
MMSTAANSPTTFWSTSVTNFVSWIEEVSSTINPPLVHSISYGAYEASVSAEEQQRFAQEAARLAARGVTIVAASGDDGVSLFGARTNAFFCGFKVPFPANVPYVVSVGATMGPETGSNQEIACSSDKGSVITSGGGFSTIFERPSYQSSHVQQYLNSPQSSPTSPLSSPLPYFPTSSMFNPNGRAIPDVSMPGNNYEIVIGGKSYQVSGTSASAPVFAAILTLANNERLNNGKSSLGFVNPALYSLSVSQPNVFNDVTVGDNRCAALPYLGGTPTCCQHGFRCSTGWDPVTGLGSVNGGRLVEALANL